MHRQAERDERRQERRPIALRAADDEDRRALEQAESAGRVERAAARSQWAGAPPVEREVADDRDRSHG